MKTRLTTILTLGAVLMLGVNQSANAALTQPVGSEQQQTQTTPARWAYHPYASHYYYYEPVVPYYYEPVVPYYYEPVVPYYAPYYYAPEPYYVQPGLSFNITL